MTATVAAERPQSGVVDGAPSSAHVPALDDLRGIAVLLVVLCHISEQFHPSNTAGQLLKKFVFAGWTGVDLFFVLSGFLITGILWDARGSSGYFRNFYARRTVRIFPLYYVTLAILFVVAPLFSGSMANDSMFRDLMQARPRWGWYCTYLVDVLIAWKGFLFAGHFWSLAVEEHFYLVWPFLVHRLLRRSLVTVCLGLIGMPLILRAAMLLSHAPTAAVYVLTPCRMDALALGGIMALTLRAPNGLQTMVRWARLSLPLSATMWLTLMLLQGGWTQYGFLAQTLGYLVTEVFYASFLVFTLASNTLAEVISIRPLRLLGKISYAVYVFHVFVVFLCARFFALGAAARPSVVFSLARYFAGRAVAPGTFLLLLDAVTYLAIALGLSIGIALLSWHTLELPCLRWKRFFPYGRAT